MPNDAPQVCPCEAVKDLKAIVERHEMQLNDGNVKFAIIDQKLENILTKLDKKDKFSAGIASSVTNIILTIILGYLAVKMGMG